MAAAAATALAVRLGTVGSVTVVAALFAGGLVSDSLLGPWLEVSFWARAAFAVLPDGQAFWLTDALDAGRGIPAAYAAGAAAYAAVWSAACLVLGAGAFRRAEVG